MIRNGEVSTGDLAPDVVCSLAEHVEAELAQIEVESEIYGDG